MAKGIARLTYVHVPAVAKTQTDFWLCCSVCGGCPRWARPVRRKAQFPNRFQAPGKAGNREVEAGRRNSAGNGCGLGLGSAHSAAWCVRRSRIARRSGWTRPSIRICKIISRYRTCREKRPLRATLARPSLSGEPRGALKRRILGFSGQGPRAPTSAHSSVRLCGRRKRGRGGRWWCTAPRRSGWGERLGGGGVPH